MAVVLGEIRLSEADVRAWASSPGGPVERMLEQRGGRVRLAAQGLVGVDSGHLRESIRVEIRNRAGLPYAWIGTDVEYARWHHDGTGVHGPAGRVITARRGRVMIWTTKTGETAVARRTRGAPGTFYLRDALPAAA